MLARDPHLWRGSPEGSGEEPRFRFVRVCLEHGLSVQETCEKGGHDVMTCGAGCRIVVKNAALNGRLDTAGVDLDETPLEWGIARVPA
jgi:hypothetical protein